MDDTIDIGHFAGVQMAVGHIVSVDYVAESDKLLNLTIDVGEEQPRTILSGISKHYTPEELTGRRCVIVANLKPRKMLGIESNGMVVCATYTDESGEEVVRVIEPPADVPVGSLLS